MGPLRGLRVVELGTYVAAPALGCMLGMLGAEVVKVEPPEGDPTRILTPWSWVNYNWNKKSVCVNLKERDGVRVFKRLVGGSDVLIESLSPGTVERLGIGYSSLKNVNPSLTYCSVKGFAGNSSSAKRAAFDTVAQAEGGLMYVTQRTGSLPSRVGNPCVDLSAAAFGVINILANVLRRPRKGAFLEIPLLDVVVYWNGYWFPYIGIKGEQPANLGGVHPGFAPYGVYEAKDGHVFIGTISDSQWKRLAERLRLKTDRGLDTMSRRVSRRASVDDLVKKAVSGLEVDEVLATLGQEVPCARVKDLDDVYSNEESILRGIIRNVEYSGKRFRIAIPPIGHPLPGPTLGCPSKGQDTSRILRGIGYNSKEMAQLRAVGVIN